MGVARPLIDNRRRRKVSFTFFAFVESTNFQLTTSLHSMAFPSLFPSPSLSSCLPSTCSSVFHSQVSFFALFPLCFPPSLFFPYLSYLHGIQIHIRHSVVTLPLLLVTCCRCTCSKRATSTSPEIRGITPLDGDKDRSGGSGKAR